MVRLYHHEIRRQVIGEGHFGTCFTEGHFMTQLILATRVLRAGHNATALSQTAWGRYRALKHTVRRRPVGLTRAARGWISTQRGRQNNLSHKNIITGQTRFGRITSGGGRGLSHDLPCPLFPALIPRTQHGQGRGQPAGGHDAPARRRAGRVHRRRRRDQGPSPNPPHPLRRDRCLRRRQGLTLVHFSAQLERFLWDRGCA
jgi:hypothetical protein